MKKFLSLVLALAMTMSLVTISAGAKDFTDADDITYVEAVDVMTAIGVVDGDAAGNFNPTNGLTRGAASKIICNLILGPTTAAELNADTAPYKDVAVNSTFAGYIAFCQKEGIISGYADGTFKPAAPLTGYAFMKMLLGALGYDADVEGYTGANWSINVAKRALGIDLNDGLVGEFNGSNYVTREEAMLYAFNALQAEIVDYDTVITVGDVTIAGSKAEGTGYAFYEKYFKNLDLDVAVDVFGRPSNTWSWKNEEIGEYAVSADKVWTAKVTEKALYAAAGSNAYDNFTWEVYFNGALNNYNATHKTYSTPKLSKTSTDAIEIGTKSGNGVVTELYVDSDTKTVNLVIYTQYVGEITKIKTVDGDDDTITVSFKNTATGISNKFDVEDASGFAKEDIVVMTAANKEIQTMVLADVVSGTVSGYKSGEYAKMDGTTYNYNKVVTVNLDGKDTDPAADSDATLYLDPYGYVVAFEATDANKDYLYVLNTDVTLGTVSAKVLLADGTSEVVTISKVDGKDAKTGKWGVANAVAEGYPYSYTISDGKYKLTTLTAGTGEDEFRKIGGFSIERGAAVMKSSTEVLVTDSNTVFVDEENDAAYTGYKAVPSFSNAGIAVIYDDNQVADIVFIYERAAGTDDGEGFFFVKDTKAFVYEKSGDDEVWTWTVYVDGEETELVTSEDLTSQITEIGLYEIESVNADNEPEAVTCKLDASKVFTFGASATVSGASVANNGVLKTDEVYLYNDETVFVTVALKNGNAKIDTVSVGSVSDINTDNTEAEYTAVYVAEVEDKDDTTPLAELVIVVVPYVD